MNIRLQSLPPRAFKHPPITTPSPWKMVTLFALMRGPDLGTSTLDCSYWTIPGLQYGHHIGGLFMAFFGTFRSTYNKPSLSPFAGLPSNSSSLPLSTHEDGRPYLHHPHKGGPFLGRRSGRRRQLPCHTYRSDDPSPTTSCHQGTELCVTLPSPCAEGDHG